MASAASALICPKARRAQVTPGPRTALEPDFDGVVTAHKNIFQEKKRRSPAGAPGQALLLNSRADRL
eukprot:6186180-Pleurochrysis_carterae.AAC.2